jgi:HTH-type transcriptional regulator/antitoxin HigA
MATSSNQRLVPARAIHPGEVLREELRERGIKQKEFAKAIDFQATHLNEFIHGKRNLTEPLAHKLEQALGIPFKFWMSMQSEYAYDCIQIKNRELEEQEAIKYEHSCMETFNLALVYKVCNIKAISAKERTKLLKEIVPFDPLSAKDKRSKVSGFYKRSNKVQIDEKNMMAWLIINWIITSKLEPIGRYEPGNGYLAAKDLAKQANTQSITIDTIKECLNGYGIQYAEVPKIDKAPVDAYSSFIKENPVISVTYRYNDMDKLVFDILHELGHIEKHLMESKMEFISVDSMEYSSDPKEREANEFAQEALIPKEVWNRMLKVGSKSLSPYKIVAIIAAEAERYGISPSIAISRYKHVTNMYRLSAYKSPKIHG